jgi:lipoprotein-anchoring transpeptidase ErfK/SrfK
MIIFRPKLFVLVLMTLGLNGCAHHQEATIASAEPAPEPEPAQAPLRSEPELMHPDNDPRYHFARANSRRLNIFLNSQTFEYLEDGRIFASGEITSGAAQHPTPTGSFRILSKNKDKRSGSYTNYFDQPTPMPYSLQFYGPYYVHEGYMPGQPESHGCVRLHYENARLLFHRMKIGDPIVVKKGGSLHSSKPLSHLFPVF